ncbi:MAG TPA: hypothetical protein PKW95_23570 [bacterium]|nr:hypothetical protein [bacterium]
MGRSSCRAKGVAFVIFSILLIGAGGLPGAVFAQTIEAQLQWAAEFTFPEYPLDGGLAIRASETGDVYLGGACKNEQNFFCAAKLSATGAVQWQTVYTNKAVRSPDAAIDAEGNVYFAGTYATYDGVWWYLYPHNAKIGADGAVAWHNTTPHEYGEGASVAVGADGNPVFGASAYDYYKPPSPQGMGAFKYSPDNELLADGNEVGDGYAKMLTDVAVDAEGAMYATGVDIAFDPSLPNFFTVKYHADGTTAWWQRYNHPNSIIEKPVALGVAPDGSVWVTGIVGSQYKDNEIFTLKYAADGTPLSFLPYGQTGNDAPTDLAVDSLGGAVVVGAVTRLGQYDAVAIKYNEYGVPQWVWELDDAPWGDDVINVAFFDAADNLYVGGYLRDGLKENAFVARLTADGATAWLIVYDGEEQQADEIVALSMDDQSAILAAGTANQTLLKSDFLALRIAQSCDGCIIAGECFDDGAVDPQSICRQCDASADAFGWSPRDGIECDDGLFCNGADMCAAGECGVHEGDPCDAASEMCNEETDTCDLAGDDDDDDDDAADDDSDDDDDNDDIADGGDDDGGDDDDDDGCGRH